MVLLLEQTLLEGNPASRRPVTHLRKGTIAPVPNCVRLAFGTHRAVRCGERSSDSCAGLEENADLLQLLRNVRLPAWLDQTHRIVCRDQHQRFAADPLHA